MSRDTKFDIVVRIREERARLEQLRQKSEAAAARASAELRGYADAIEMLDRLEGNAFDDTDEETPDVDQVEASPARTSRSSSPRPSPAPAATPKPAPIRRAAPPASTEEEKPEAGRVIDIGNGRGELLDDTNFSHCVDALSRIRFLLEQESKGGVA